MSDTPPIRLLFVLTAPVRGGIEEVVLSLLARLDRSEFTLGLSAPASLLEQMRAELDACPVQTFPVAAESWLDWRSVRKLARCIRAFKPDIVNPHLFRSTLVAAPLAKWLGVRCVVETYHGREAWRRGGFFRAGFFIDHLVSHCVDRVIAVSEAAKGFLVKVKRIPASKVTVVPNGRDLSVFQPGCGRADVRRELGISANAQVLGIVGRLEEQKGHRYGLEAFAQVAKEFPDARLLIVGDGGLRPALEQQARDLAVSDRVIFTGFRTDVPRLYDAMDIVVLPSLYEGMPLTAIEAAAMGKPVVATAVDGTPEVVVDRETGLSVPPADTGALRAAMARVLKDAALVKTLGSTARRRAYARFDIGIPAAATAAEYRLAVNNGKRLPTILHVEAATTYGGSARALETYLRCTSRGRFRNLICLYTPLAAASRLSGTSDGLWIIPVDQSSQLNFFRLRARASQFFAFLALLRLMTRERVDLVRLNNAPSVHGAAVFAALVLRRPSVAWLRSFPPAGRWTLKSRWLMNRRQLHVAVSDAVRLSYLERGLPAGQVQVLYDGTLCSESIPLQWSDRQSSSFAVGFLGRIVPWKGLWDILRAAAIARRECADLQVQIVGPDEPSTRGFRLELLEGCRSLGISDAVFFHPEANDPTEFLLSIQCLVNASSPAEPFGLSLLEAMALGVPVVATDAGGPAEIIEHDVSGLLVPPNDPGALAKALIRLAKDPELRMRLGLGGRERAIRQFDARDRTMDHENLFATILERSA